MPLFVDVHTIDGGVSAEDLAQAHEADIATQGRHHVRFHYYGVDEAAGEVFCLAEAPNAEAFNAVHREAHGPVADEIYAVSQHT